MIDVTVRVYWKGSHWKRLKQAIDAAREEAERGAIQELAETPRPTPIF